MYSKLNSKLNLRQITKHILKPNIISIHDTKYFSVYRTSNKNKELIVNEKDIGQMKNHKITNMELIDKNYGLREFIKKTYLYTGGGICGSIGLGVVGGQIIQFFPEHLLGVLGLGTVLGLGGAFGIGFTKYSTHKDIISVSKSNVKKNDKKDQVEILYSVNSTERIISYGCLVTGMGMTMIPICLVFPNALLPAFVASSSIFGASTLWAMKKGVGELEPYGSVLYGGLGGLVGVSLLGLGSNIFFGTNWFGDMTHLISLYGGIPLFTGLIAYDTHKSIEMYESGEPDHLGCSTQLYLDFLNLFIRFVEIIGKIQSNKD